MSLLIGSIYQCVQQHQIRRQNSSRNCTHFKANEEKNCGRMIDDCRHALRKLADGGAFIGPCREKRAFHIDEKHIRQCLCFLMRMMTLSIANPWAMHRCKCTMRHCHRIEYEMAGVT